MRRVSSGRKHPGLSERATLRGAALKRWPWSAHVGTRGVSSLSANSETDDHGVLEQSRRRGTFSHLGMRARILRRGEVLYSRPFDPRNSSPSFQPRIGATGKRFVVSPASGPAKSGGLRRFTHW